jgi:hypothetical protein
MWIAIARSNLSSVLVMSNFGSALPGALLALGGMLTFVDTALGQLCTAEPTT